MTEENRDPYKLYCVVSKAALKLMNGNRGKFGTQCGHAYVHALMNGMHDWPEAAAGYLYEQQAFKITLFVETTAELLELHELYKDKAGTALIEDAGYTVFKEPTVTCLGIGPIRQSDCEDILKSLRPLI